MLADRGFLVTPGRLIRLGYDLHSSSLTFPPGWCVCEVSTADARQAPEVVGAEWTEAQGTVVPCDCRL